MKADRLLSILLLLQNKGKLTARELADELEVSERTILRDMEALSIAGVPVYAERGHQGGWVLAEGYRTNLTGMKAQEIASLLTASHPSLLADLGMKGHYDAAFQKLLASSPSSIRKDAELIRSRIHIDGAGWHDVQEAFPALAAVQEAVWAERKLRIDYSRGQETVTRLLHPLGLIAKRNVWYLAAKSEADDETYRTYRISRITKAELMDEPFTRPNSFDLAAYWEQSTAQFKQSLPHYIAEVRLHESALRQLEKERFIAVIQSREAAEGWHEAQVDFAAEEFACAMLLRLGAQAEVLAPAQLRNKVLAEARALVKLYGG